MEDFLKDMNLDSKNIREIQMMSPLVLAYIGDAVFEVYIRNYIIHKFKGKVNDFHKASTKFVKASAQAKIIHGIMDQLSEKELRIVKRGRNQKSSTVPKNADIADYRYATGFESLIGYLFLQSDKTRLKEIISSGIDIIEENKHVEDINE